MKSGRKAGEQGSFRTVTASGMLALIVAAGHCVDISRLYVLRGGLQNAADAAAVAGAPPLNPTPAGIAAAAARAPRISKPDAAPTQTVAFAHAPLASAAGPVVAPEQ